MDQDIELVQRWAQGESLAGAGLVLRHIAALKRFFRDRAPGEADDLVQETILGCLEGARRFRGEASFSTFVRSVAYNNLYASYRRGARTHEHLGLQFDDIAREPDSAGEFQTASERLTEGMAELPEHLRRVLELTYWENLPCHDVARVLGIPLGTVASRIRRARVKLRATLSDLVDAEAGPSRRSTHRKCAGRRREACLTEGW